MNLQRKAIYENRNEASLIDGIDIIVVKNIADVVNFIENGVKILLKNKNRKRWK